MPVFNLELKFDKSGALKVNKIMGDVSKSADSAQKSIGSIGAASSNAGKIAVKAGQDIASAMKDAAKQVIAFVGAYRAIEGLKGFAQAGIQSNASWEQSKIGIASVIASVQKLEDAQGNLLSGQQAYNAALGLAEKAMNQIKIMGLETTATTEDLVSGFQQILGPASAAGLSMEQTLKFTTSMVQSLGAIGIPFNQLSAEARSLLDGTIVPTQDRLATTLGITGDMVKNWKEQGVLAEKLLEKMSAFAAAGDDVAKTWAGLTSNLQDSFDVIASTASAGLYDSLKESLMVIQSALTSTEQGASGISKDFENIVAVLSEIETALGQAILESVKSFASVLKDANKALENFDSASALDGLATAIKTVAAAYIAMKVSRGLATNAQIAGTVADVRATGVIQTLIDKITSYDTALQERIAAEELSARSSFNALKVDIQRLEKEKEILTAQERRADALATRLIGTKNEERAERVLASTRERLAAVNNQLETSEGKLQSSMLAVFRTSQGATLAQAAWSGLKTVASGVLSLFGGPLGAAFTAATAGLTYLTTKQTEAEKAANLHGLALKALNEITKAASKENKNLADSLDGVSEARRRMGIEAATESLAKFAGSIKLLDFSSSTYFLPDFKEQAQELDDLAQSVQNGEASFADFKQRLAAVYIELDKSGEASSRFGQRVKEALDLAAKGADAELVLKRLKGEIKDTTEETKKQADAAKVSVSANNEASKALAHLTSTMNKMPKTGQDAYDAVMKLTDGTKSAKNAAKEQNLALIESARAHLANAEAAAEAAVATAYAKAEMSGIPAAANAMIATALQNLEKIRQARANFEERVTQWQAGDGGGRSGGGGGKSDAARRAEEEARALKDLQDKIARLQKTDEQYNNDKLNEELTELTQKYPKLKEVIDQYGEAQRKAWADDKAKENLEIQTEFYRDFSQMAGESGLALEEQNRLIDEQRQKWIDAGIPIDDVNRRVQLMKEEIARDPWSGMMRHTRKWAADTQNLADSVGQVLTNTFDGAADALANFVMTGKINFNSLANSIIADLARIAARQAIGGIAGGIMSGLGSMVGGLFSSGFSMGGTSNMTAAPSAGTDAMFGNMASFELHSGGMVWEHSPVRSVPMSLFAGAPRYHNGRFYDPSFEVPAIIRKDESVLTPGQMRAIAGAGGGTFDVRVQVNNETSVPVEAEARAQDNGNGFDMTLIIHEIDRGMAGLARSGKSTYTKMMEQNYGLNRASVLARGRR